MCLSVCVCIFFYASIIYKFAAIHFPPPAAFIMRACLPTRPQPCWNFFHYLLFAFVAGRSRSDSLWKLDFCCTISTSFASAATYVTIAVMLECCRWCMQQPCKLLTAYVTYLWHMSLYACVCVCFNSLWQIKVFCISLRPHSIELCQFLKKLAIPSLPHMYTRPKACWQQQNNKCKSNNIPCNNNSNACSNSWVSSDF